MRPVRLELAGFTAFRDPVTVDFEGTDLFALVGPTGSGKSSLIDAMCFALYGSVPRLDRRAVAPVIAVGKVEARVRLDFAVGTETYTAARVVRLTGPGRATTKEARLEHGQGADESGADGSGADESGADESGATRIGTLAGDADAVTAAVEELLGLSFEQFTKCVVLPQGEFARFLHDTPKGRQELLVRLLGLDVLGRMREAATRCRVEAETRRDAAASQRAGLAHATDEAVAAASDRVACLDALRQRLRDDVPRLTALALERNAARDDAHAARDAADRLGTVAVPAGVAALAEAAATADRAHAHAEAAVAEAEKAALAAEQRRADLDDVTTLEQVRAAHEQRAALHARRDRGAPLVAAAHAAEARSDEALAAADEALRSAQDAVLDVRRRHAAADLAGTLVPGAPCPVCAQPIPTGTAGSHPRDPAPPVGRDAPRPVPTGTAGSNMRDAARPVEAEHGDAIAEAEAEVARRQAVRTEAQAALRGRTDERARAEETMAAVLADLAALDDRLAGAPDAEEVGARMAAIADADRELTAARAGERTARDRSRSAAIAARQARKARDGAWAVYDATRDAVAPLVLPSSAAPAAGLGVPAPDRGDLERSWAALAAWAAGTAAGQRAAAAGAEQRARDADTAHARLAADVAAACEAAGVADADAVPDALAAAREAHRRLVAELARAKALAIEEAQHGETATVAQALGRHLAANRFEQWLLDEAVAALAAGASDTLRALSGGHYSLAIDAQRAFSVVDHRNADEQRPARTLSGGETFLASLALALTLAEHLRGFSAATAAMESIFLDEGFGTLDAETLDAVTAAIEELGASGRTVGLVTHVRELAERVPVRFEVRPGPAGSTVERVEA